MSHQQVNENQCDVLSYSPICTWVIFNYETGTLFSFTALCIMVSKFLGSTTTLMKFMGTGSSVSRKYMIKYSKLDTRWIKTMLANRKVFKSVSESRWREDPECSGLTWSNKSCEVSVAEATQTALDSSSYCSCVALWMGGRHWYLSGAEIYVSIVFTWAWIHISSFASRHCQFIAFTVFQTPKV